MQKLLKITHNYSKLLIFGLMVGISFRVVNLCRIVPPVGLESGPLALGHHVCSSWSTMIANSWPMPM